MPAPAHPHLRRRLLARLRLTAGARAIGWLALAFAIIAIVPPAPAAPDRARVFRAGAATGDITPELGQLLIGDWTPTPAKHLHDRLQVKALVLDDGDRRLALVVCDNLGLPREACDEIRRLTHAQTGLDPAALLISATHSHSAASANVGRAAHDAIVELEARSGPTADAAATAAATQASYDAAARYQHFIARRVADTVQCAINQLVPARVGWSRAAEPTSVFNRRWYVRDEKERRNPFGGVDAVRMNPPRASATLVEPAGPTDPDIPFLAVQTRAGRPLALFAVYSLHYVGGVPAGTVSADYYGAFAARLAELVGAERQDPPFVGIMANGTSGNINNIDFRAPAPANRAPFEQIRRVADRVADAVWRSYQNIEYHDWAPLAARREELTVAYRRPDAAQLARARGLLAAPAAAPGWHRYELLYARRVVARASAPATVALPLQALRIGDFALLTIPAEAFVEIGLELKQRAPFPQTAVISIAHGYYGYLPTPEQHRLGGYETWLGTNLLEVDASTKITATLLRLAEELRP